MDFPTKPIPDNVLARHARREDRRRVMDDLASAFDILGRGLILLALGVLAYCAVITF